METAARQGTPSAENAAQRAQMQELIGRVQSKKEALVQLSQELFKTHQEFLKKFEDLRLLRVEGRYSLHEYADQMRFVALKEADVKYQQDEVANIEIGRQHVLADKQRCVVEERNNLQRALDQYRGARAQIADLQRLVTAETEEERHQTEEIVEALHRAKSTLEAEMRRPSLRASFPPRKEISRARDEFLKCLQITVKDMRDFHTDKIIGFRRQERILMGRVKDTVEQQSGQKSVKGAALEAPVVSALEGIDSLENRIAQRMFASPANEDKYNDSEMDEIGLPDLNSPGRDSRRPGNPRNRRFSILQNGEVERLQSKWGGSTQSPHKTMSSTSQASQTGPNWQQKKLLGNADVIYDPDLYTPFCSGEYIRPHVLLDVNHGLGEKEERIVNLASMLCNAKGKVIQLNSIKEGLDVLLLKHASLLLALLEQLHAGVLTDPVGESHRGSYYSRPPVLDLALTANNKVLLADIARKEREIAHWRQRNYATLFAPDTSIVDHPFFDEPRHV